MLGKIEGRRKSRVTEDEMVGWHCPLNGHEFGQTPRDSEGQGSLACCSPWSHKESDTTERLNNNKSCSSEAESSQVSKAIGEWQGSGVLGVWPTRKHGPGLRAALPHLQDTDASR